MLSIQDARLLLEGARTSDGLVQCAKAFDFASSTPVGETLQVKLGLAGLAESFEICEGRGTLRALVARLRHGDPARDTLAAIARQLSTRVPHLLWIVISTDGQTHVGIAVWRSVGSRIRVHALLADPSRISESDAHTFCALAAGTSSSDSVTHLRWTEILGREAVTVRFFRALRSVVDGLSESIDGVGKREQRDELALVYVSRLLFLSFVETKGWLDGDHDFLSNTFIQCMTAGGSYHKRVLTPLFFGTLNTPVSRRAAKAREFGRVPFLNGGLFGRTPGERLLRFEFPDEALGHVFGDLLTRFRFTGEEQSVDISDSAIDPEILGRAFESLMQRESRKSSGAYYTPQAVVQRVTDAALEALFSTPHAPATTMETLLRGLPLTGRSGRQALDRISAVRVLDPACGSGAFLVYMQEKLAAMRGLCGDTRPIGERRRDVLANSIYGVDINPTAVWLCELRLWLSVVVHADGGRVAPLPNLDRNIRVGDSLCSRPPTRPGMAIQRDAEGIRVRYVRSVGTRKKIMARVLERMERRNAADLLAFELDAIAAARKDLLFAMRSRNLFGERGNNAHQQDQLALLRRRRNEVRRAAADLKNGAALPFSFQTHFPDVFARGGFDLLVGNPPWVRLHQIAKASRESFRNTFEIFRTGRWSIGAARASAGAGFASQIDLSALFVERSIGITRANGCIALLLPSKLWKSLAGGSVRSFVSRTCDIQALEDFAGAKAMFDATTYPSLLVARKRRNSEAPSGTPMTAVVHRRRDVLHWKMSADMLPLEQSCGSPWLLVPSEVRSGFDKLAASGVPLAESRFGRPVLGVKTGLNEAFIRQFGELPVEPHLVRSVIKGEAIEQWNVRKGSEGIIWTHASNGDPLQSLPPLASAWFHPWKKSLMQRTDARGDKLWWRLFRTEGSDSSRHRVVWSDIGRAPQAAVIPSGDTAVPLNTCYVVRCDSEIDSNALATLLNSPLTAAWLSLIADPAQGGYNRYLGWTMAMLPLPRDWIRHRRSLSGIYERAAGGSQPDPHELFAKSLKLYGLTANDVEDMMAWSHA